MGCAVVVRLGGGGRVGVGGGHGVGVGSAGRVGVAPVHLWHAAHLWKLSLKFLMFYSAKYICLQIFLHLCTITFNMRRLGEILMELYMRAWKKHT